MGNYKVVFRDDWSGDSSLLKWEPGCPAMVTVVQVARNVDTSEAYLQIKIENLSADILNSISGIAHVDYADGSRGYVPFSELDLDLPQCEQGALKATALPRGDVEVRFRSSCFKSTPSKGSGTRPESLPKRPSANRFR